MDINSCDNCGVVLDFSKMNFQTTMPDETESSILDIEWDGDCYHPTLPCPVCENQIVNKEIRL